MSGATRFFLDPDRPPARVKFDDAIGFRIANPMGEGSSLIMQSAPRPIGTPPTEVAMRKPCAVVSNSR
jgi:hypothetical protein